MQPDYQWPKTILDKKLVRRRKKKVVIKQTVLAKSSQKTSPGKIKLNYIQLPDKALELAEESSVDYRDVFDTSKDASLATSDPYHKESNKIADLVIEKQTAYGDSFGKSGKIMSILYPEGIKPPQMDDALTVVRIIDKLFRIATNKTAFDENPWKDIQGYALLSTVRDNTSKDIYKIDSKTPNSQFKTRS